MLKQKYYASKNCESEDGKHQIEKIKDPIWYAQCKICGERFTLMSETVIKQLNLQLEPRPLKRTIN